jgi:hypothetical protein
VSHTNWTEVIKYTIDDCGDDFYVGCQDSGSRIITGKVSKDSGALTVFYDCWPEYVPKRAACNGGCSFPNIGDGYCYECVAWDVQRTARKYFTTLLVAVGAGHRSALSVDEQRPMPWDLETNVGRTRAFVPFCDNAKVRFSLWDFALTLRFNGFHFALVKVQPQRFFNVYGRYCMLIFTAILNRNVDTSEGNPAGRLDAGFLCVALTVDDEHPDCRNVFPQLPSNFYGVPAGVGPSRHREYNTAVLYDRLLDSHQYFLGGAGYFDDNNWMASAQMTHALRGQGLTNFIAYPIQLINVNLLYGAGADFYNPLEAPQSQQLLDPNGADSNIMFNLLGPDAYKGVSIYQFAYVLTVASKSKMVITKKEMSANGNDLQAACLTQILMPTLGNLARWNLRCDYETCHVFDRRGWKLLEHTHFGTIPDSLKRDQANSYWIWAINTPWQFTNYKYTTAYREKVPQRSVHYLRDSLLPARPSAFTDFDHIGSHEKHKPCEYKYSIYCVQ